MFFVSQVSAMDGRYYFRRVHLTTEYRYVRINRSGGDDLGSD